MNPSCHYADKAPVEHILCAGIAVRAHKRTQMKEATAVRQRLDLLKFERTAERVTFANRRQMITAMPCDDCHQVRQSSSCLACSQPYRVTSIYQATATAIG